MVGFGCTIWYIRIPAGLVPSVGGVDYVLLRPS